MGASSRSGLAGIHRDRRANGQLLHLAVVPVLQRDEALSDLEEVAIGLVGCKVYAEDKVAISRDLLLDRQDFEWVLDQCVGGLIKNWEQGPVDLDWEVEIVLQGQLA